jgi:hypothetical protein
MFITLLFWAFIGLVLTAAVEYSVLKVKPTLSMAIGKYLVAVIVVVVFAYFMGQLLGIQPEGKPKAPLFAKVVAFAFGGIGIFVGRWVTNLIKDRS